MLTLGIDEAGRGPVLGPMVLSCVCLDAHAADFLMRSGLRDSKLYRSNSAKSQRANTASIIYKVAIHVGVYVADVSEIDRRVRKGQLNLLECEIAETLITQAPRAGSIIADGERLFAPLTRRYSNLTAFNKAESLHCAVAAASIVAKHRRDEIFERIQRRYRPVFGEFGGGGYMNSSTRNFLRTYFRRVGKLPPEARRSWPYKFMDDLIGVDFDPYEGTGLS